MKPTSSVKLFAAGGADDVHSDLRRLLDTMTPLYKARMEALSDQARNTRGPWIEVVKSSLSLTLPEKEHVADAAKDLTEPEYRERLKALQDERDRWAGDRGEAAAVAVRDAVLAGHFFPDCPDSKLAPNQILGCFGDDPRAIVLALDLFARHHRDEWLEKVVRRALDLDPKVAILWTNLGLLLSEQPERVDEAEAAYRRAAELDPSDPSDPYPLANPAHLSLALGRHLNRALCGMRHLLE